MATATACVSQNSRADRFSSKTALPKRSSRRKTSPRNTAPSRAPPRNSSTTKSRRTSKKSSTATTTSPSPSCKKSGELGLLGITTPEKFGGMELDLTSAMVVAEAIARDGSYAAWHGAHAGIGTLPLLLFGTEEQKQKYLPKLSTAEMVGAYCLTEPRPVPTRWPPTPAPTSAPTAPTTSSTARRCGSPMAARPTFTPSSPRSSIPMAARSSPPSWSSAHFPASSRPRRKEDGHQGQFHHRHLPRQRQGARGKPARRNRPRPHHRVQHPEPRPPEAGAVRRRRRQGGAATISAKYAKERKAFGTTIARVRHDPAQAGRDGDPDLRHRIA